MEGGIRQISAGVIGAGAWGKAFAQILESSGWRVTIWNRDIGEIQSLKNGTLDIRKAVNDVDLIALAVPCSAIREVCNLMRDQAIDAPVLNLAKGLEAGTLLRPSQIISEILGDEIHVAALGGPNLAAEISQSLPAVGVLACENGEIARFLSTHVANKNFAVRPSGDVIGVEIAGVCKNVFAIAVGLARGAGLGENFAAALTTASVREMAMIGVAAGGGIATFYGPTGMGDLIATSSSGYSRNYSFGRSIGQKKTLNSNDNKTIEGRIAAPALLQFAKNNGVEMPIVAAIAKLVGHEVSVDESIDMLRKAALK